MRHRLFITFLISLALQTSVSLQIYAADATGAQEAVDLGLSVLWADRNIGAEEPWQPGDYYTWHDQAIYNRNGKWRTPGKREWDELMENCKFRWTDSFNGKAGYIVTSCVPGFEGRQIFIPAAGWIDSARNDTVQYSQYGSYWTSDLGWDNINKKNWAFGFNFDRRRREWHGDDLSAAQSVRTVMDIESGQVGEIGIIDSETGERVDKGLIAMQTGHSRTLLIGASQRCVSAACRWKSSNTDIAEVSDDGVIFAHRNGTVTITAQVYGRKVKCRLRVEGEPMQSVDLGLTRRWATANIGADSPAEAGYFFAFAEPMPKSSFRWSNYAHGSSKDNLFRYAGSSGEELRIIDDADDAATAHLGWGWNVPDIGELYELERYCDSRWIKLDGTWGVQMTSRIPGFEDRSIFIPAGGQIAEEGPVNAGKEVRLWTSSTNGNFGFDFAFEEGQRYREGNHGNVRYVGQNVRAVEPLKDSDVESVVMDRDSIELMVSASVLLEAGLTPSRGKLPMAHAFTWRSSNELVARVSDLGLVTAVAPGSCKISAEIGNRKAECNVTVHLAQLEGTDLGLSVEWADRNLGAGSPFGTGSGYYDTNDRIPVGIYAEHWRVPTDDEVLELLKLCSWTYSDSIGWTVRGANGNEILIPILEGMDCNPLRETPFTFADGRFYKGSAGFRYGNDRNYIYLNNEGDPTFNHHDEFLLPLRLVRDIPGRADARQNILSHLPECHCVDMGLSVLWAAENLGAADPSQSGELFSWGETVPKLRFGTETYKYYIPGSYGMSKYNNQPEQNEYDGLTVLEPTDDAATANLGDGWKTPSAKDWQELMDSCTWQPDSLNGKPVWRVTSNVRGYEDASIFIPLGPSGSTINAGLSQKPYFRGQYMTDEHSTRYDDDSYVNVFTISNRWEDSTKAYSSDRYLLRSEGFLLRPVHRK